MAFNGAIIRGFGGIRVDELLRSIMYEIAWDGIKVNNERLGIWISKREGYTVQGLRFRRSGKKHKMVVWTVEDASEETAITPFIFEGKEIRVQLDEQGEPRWVAKDVCDVLELSNSRMAVDRLDDDEKGVSQVYTHGGMQTLQTINESGLYTLILRSDKPQAKPFRKWVTSDVLPAIRKTGTDAVAGKQYRQQQAIAPSITSQKTLLPLPLPELVKVYKSFIALARAAGLRGDAAAMSANEATRKVTGVDCLELLGRSL